MRRRHFLTVSVASVGGLLIYSLDRRPHRVLAQERLSLGSIRIDLRHFTESEALDVAAAAARILPSDESGPGASEAGVVVYIDRQLAGPYGRDKYRYSVGPFAEGAPEQGYQGRESPRDIYRQGLARIAGMARLQPAAQDQLLRTLEDTLFFNLLRTHTIEGMFCDPMHGGNIDMIGWQWIGFPGPRMSYRDEIEQYHGLPFRPKPLSLAQVLGKRVKPSEEE